MRWGCFEERVSPESAGASAATHVAKTVSCWPISRSTPVQPGGSIRQRTDPPIAVSACLSIRNFYCLGDPPTRRSWTRRSLLINACLLLAEIGSSWACAQTEAAGYKFQIIAQPGDVIDGQTITGFDYDANPVAINTLRQVVFMAELGDSHRLAIMTSDRLIAGAGKVVDGVVPFFSEDNRVSLNDAGQVAYAAVYEDAADQRCCEEGVFLNDKLLVGTDRQNVIDGKKVQNVAVRPVINNQGTIAFVARFEGDLGGSLLTQEGIVAGPGHPLADGTPILGLFGPQINDAGTIAFTSALPDKNNAAIFTQDGLLVESSENVPGGGINVNTVIDGRVIGGDITSFGISSSGEVAFWAVIAQPSGGSGGPFGQGLFTQNRLLVQDADVVDGKTIVGIRFGRQFSNSGMFSFLADIPGGEGLFVDNRLVIETGDMIQGRTVTDFNPLVGMNDRGDLAFLAHFQGGGSAIVMATIPEPSTSLLAAVAIAVLVFRRTRDRSRQ